jgi:hypothetical protein
VAPINTICVQLLHQGSPAYQTLISLEASQRAPYQKSRCLSPVTVITFRNCISNSALFHTQLHIHSTAAIGNVTYHIIFMH